MDKTKEVYISFDVETDGPCAGLNSMLSLGAAAVGWNTETHKWEVSHTFSANIKPLHDCSPDFKTMEEFWRKNPEAWKAATSNPEDAEDAMNRFRILVASVETVWGCRPTAVGAPATFDYAFVRYYMLRFLGNDYPFGHSCLDMKSVAATVLKIRYYDAGKRGYPKNWSSDKFKHTHIAVEDAIEQAYLWSHIVDAQ